MKHKIAAFVLLLGILVLEACAPPKEAEAPLAPEIQGRLVQGGHFSLASLRGQVVLINFWATWCRPSRYEIPDLIKLEAEHQQKGFQVLGICVDKIASSKLRRFVRGKGLNYAVLADPQGAIPKLYGGFLALPSSLLLDREGRIRQMHVGLVDLADREKEIGELLSETANARTN